MDTARIEEVIGDFVQLKKSGSNFKGLSPFSNEKTPSFMVSPAKQIFKDFSSGKGGSVVTFLMEHEQFSYPEALRYLAKRYNIEIEETGQSPEEIAQRSKRESLFLVNDFANQHFQKLLWDDDAGRAIGLSYFKERGFSEETIKEFQLGYSEEGYQAFTDHALAQGYELEYLSEVGLTKVDGPKKIDRFRGRVMFPILSHTGRVLGFGGRTLKKDAKVAKYLNSPESEIYHKSKILYGIFQAKSHIAREEECFLVEGYTDVISLHQAGVRNVVASSGTALTVDQILLIKRYTPNITLLYDGDPAGIKASLRGIDLILEQGMQVNVVLFPDGDDPDSYSKRVSTVELKDYLKTAKQNFLRFKAELLLSNGGDDPLAKANAAREMVQSIALIPQELERSAYVQETARILGMEERILFSELGQQRASKIDRAEKLARRQQSKEEHQMKVVEKAQEPAIQAPLEAQERALCGLLLNFGDRKFQWQEDEEEETVAEYVMSALVQDELNFNGTHYQHILEHFIKVYNEDDRIATAEEFLRGGNKELMHLVVDLLDDGPDLHDWRRKRIYPPAKDSGLKSFTEEAVLRYKEKRILQLLTEFQERLKKGEELSEEERESYKQLIYLRVEINQRLKRIV